MCERCPLKPASTHSGPGSSAPGAFSSSAEHGSAAVKREGGTFPFSSHQQPLGGLGKWPDSSASPPQSQAMLQSSIHAHARSSAESSLSLSSHGEHGAREKDGASGAGQDTDDRDMCAGAGGVGSSGSGHRERGGDFDATLEQVQQENVSLRAKVETLQSTLKKVVQGVGRGQDGHSNPDGGALRFGVRACLCVCVYTKIGGR